MEKNYTELESWLCLGKNTKLGSAAFSEILSKNMPISEIISLNEAKLKALKFSDSLIKEILKCQKFDGKAILNELNQREIKIVRIIDENYPKLLKEIFDPPPILYYRGNLESDSFKLGIVGSRKPTQYGIETTEEIASFLAINNVTVVSGMAIGIDTAAHRATLDNKGKTIAVLGCGLDQIYPSSNVKLAKEIIEKGAIVSEFPIGVPPLKHNFPLRNRIISGLCSGVIITEATEKSGSLITASNSLDQNREIFAVPGPIHNKNSQGPNNLIKMGAKIITKASDILEEYDFEVKDGISEPPKGENEFEVAILKSLELEPKNIDIITKETQLAQNIVSTQLTMMEISGKVKHIGGMVYKINY